MMMMMTVSDFYCFITDHHGCLAVVPLDGTGQKEKMVGYRPMTSHHPRAACRQKHSENSSPSGVRPRNSRPSSCYQTIGEWSPKPVHRMSQYLGRDPLHLHFCNSRRNNVDSNIGQPGSTIPSCLMFKFGCSR